MSGKKEYPFRLLCKRCNSYRYTTIEQETRPGMLFNLIKLECHRCGIVVDVTEELFDVTAAVEEQT